MERYADLHLLGATLRLKPGEQDTHDAAKQWEEVLGIKAQEGDVLFTNARMGFTDGVEGKAEGIVEIRIGVEGRERLTEIFERARYEGCKVDQHQGTVEMLGVQFVFIQFSEGAKSKL
jgi:hypothetical protein